jgi:hypothetical protein
MLGHPGDLANHGAGGAQTGDLGLPRPLHRLKPDLGAPPRKTSLETNAASRIAGIIRHEQEGAMETGPEVEVHATGELISPWRSLARYQPPRTLTERLMDYALYALWVFAVVAAGCVLLVHR